MKRVLAIAKLNLLELFRDRTELASVIVLPLLLTWVFGTAFGASGVERPVEIPVADLDGSVYSEAIVEAIDEARAFEVKMLSEAEARALVRDEDAPVAVIVPAGIGAALEAGDMAKVETLRHPASQNAQAAVEVVEGAVSQVSANVAAARLVVDEMAPPRADAAARLAVFRDAYATAAGFWEPDPPVDVTAKAVRASEARAAESEAPANTQYSLGFAVFFVFMIAMGSASGVLEDRELGTLRRILGAPVRRAEILGGKILGIALVAAFEAAILVVFGAVVFGVPWGKDPLAIAVLLLALILAATGLGVMVSALVRTRSQLSALAPVLSTSLAMLGGCYWPIEVTSQTMQTVAKFTPTGWAMAGLKDVVARGAGLDSVMLPVAILLGFGLLSLAVGVTRLRLQ